MRRVLIAVLALVVIAGCATDADTGDETTTSTTTSTIPAPPDPPEEEPGSTESGTTTTTASAEDVGTRDNPVPVGESRVVGNYEVSVISYEGDATAAVLAHNEFNEPPQDGSVYSLITLSITYVGDESGDPWVDLFWSGVGDSNVSAETGDCSTYPDNIFDAGELFPGGSIEANVCLTVNELDVSSLLLILEEGFSIEESRSFFALP